MVSLRVWIIGHVLDADKRDASFLKEAIII
mgnify:CR=1 FL=1|jgi:hypothetical protein